MEELLPTRPQERQDMFHVRSGGRGATEHRRIERPAPGGEER
jgi:hypothetical protein